MSYRLLRSLISRAVGTILLLGTCTAVSAFAQCAVTLDNGFSAPNELNQEGGPSGPLT